MLRIVDLTIHYANEVILDAVSLEVGTGEVVSLVGPSGEGKTTLLRVIAGIERAESGSVFVDGRDVTACQHINAELGWCFKITNCSPTSTLQKISRTGCAGSARTKNRSE
jgi:ABC-type sugar transport system ATPase subunit